MSTTDSPQRSERRDVRYPLHLPVSLKVADKELHTRSENISLGGILLSSAFLIPEGSIANRCPAKTGPFSLWIMTGARRLK